MKEALWEIYPPERSNALVSSIPGMSMRSGAILIEGTVGITEFLGTKDKYHDSFTNANIYGGEFLILIFLT